MESTHGSDNGIDEYVSKEVYFLHQAYKVQGCAPASYLLGIRSVDSSREYLYSLKNFGLIFIMCTGARLAFARNRAI